MDELTKHFADNLKLIRKENNYSLDDLAELSGVSKSMLRQIEKGESSPSISTVWKIANGLKVSFTSLLDKPQNEVAVVGFNDTNPLTEESNGYRLFPLFPFESDRKFEIYFMEVDQNASIESEGHAGNVEEYVFVYSGCLTVTVAEESFKVDTNQVIRFNASQAHGYSNSKKTMVRAIMIIYYGLKEG